MTDKVHEQPRLTFSALAKLMAPHTSEGMRGIVRDSKYPKNGPMLNYTNAIKHMVGTLVDGQPASVALREHERDVLSTFDPQLLKLRNGFEFRRSNTRERSWPYRGVQISMFAEVSLRGPRGTGCLKLYCPQEPLAKGVGKAMASLMAYYRGSVLEDDETIPGYCLVYEVRSGRVHKASSVAVTDGFLSKVDAACDMATALWPMV